MASFFRFNLAKKMLLVYLPLSAVIILISAFALSTLKRLNSINDSIIKTDMPIRDTTNKMIDILLAEELYGHRYAILKSPEMLELFRERSKEFDSLINEISKLPDRNGIPIDQIASLHKEYSNLFINGFNHLRKLSSSRAKRYNEEIKKTQEELIKLIKNTSSKASQNRNKKTLMITEIGNKAFRITALLSIFGIIIGVGASLLITRNIVNSINQLRTATQKISEGKFDQIHTIQNHDELGELSRVWKRCIWMPIL
ncbi:MAG: HAMP domain-containing protein [Deltaproteobacteria bacterium]|nr:HAMP domain-containing protein [Deltaproteobacteria bacterium]